MKLFYKVKKLFKNMDFLIGGFILVFSILMFITDKSIILRVVDLGFIGFAVAMMIKGFRTSWKPIW